MITFKKSHAEKMLQIALALSILQLDPENYFEQRWNAHLELHNGNGWQLEMLRAVPILEYPYANRKAMMPLIEDLVRFNSQTNVQDVTAYLLNVQNGQTNQTSSSQDPDGNIAGAVAVDMHPSSNNSNQINQEIDLFLNSEHFQDQTSIIDQNIADLNEYGDMQFSTFPYFGLPLKDDPPEVHQSEFLIAEDSIRAPSTLEPLFSNNSVASTLPTESQLEHEENLDKINITLKTKPECSVSSSKPLTPEESEIVEVLWKQDVDLGYCLSPPKNEKSSQEASSQKSSNDEIEKLKALEELKDDKSKDGCFKDELNDEWAGIPFTIDNETGEYIRLPLQLDEILQDVLHLADLNTPDEVQSNRKNNEKLTKEEDKANSLTDDFLASVDPPHTEVEIPPTQTSFFGLENANELDELDMMIQSAGPFQHHRSGQNYGSNSVFRQSGFHHHHQSRVPLSRGVSMEQRLQDIASLFNPIPGMGVGMGVGEMAPYSHYPTHYPYQSTTGIPPHSQFPHAPHPVLHNASLADLSTTQPHYGHNLGSAVSSSMHLTNSSHEADAGATAYKMEHDMMYYSNTSSELNHTTEGFINSILNDEDLQLMDMGVNENFCSMRMLEGNTTSNNSSVLGPTSGGNHASHLLSMTTNIGSLSNEVIVGSTGDRLDASSDSAVSSMGSERVPSLSDGEWGDAGSDSAQDYHQGKYGGPYDYSYNGRLNDPGRQPVAQKKHQMFGKRYFQEQPSIPNLSQPSTNNQTSDNLLTQVKYEYESYGIHQGGSVSSNMEGAVGPAVNKEHIPLMTSAEMKYACSLDFSARPPRGSHDLIHHNHTYSLPQGSGSTPRPQIRDKKQKKAEEEHLTRDEKRARALNIPIQVHDIINLPMDEFNERLSKYDLSENQLSLIRDIRRRGKNKVAAQNCRKRKLDQILTLEDEVKEVRRRKDRLYQERDIVLAERKRIASKFATLHRHVFQYLRDSEGNPCSPSQYSLQQAADGSVYLLRRETNKPEDSNTTANHTLGTSSHHHSSQGSSPRSQHQKE